MRKKYAVAYMNFSDNDLQIKIVNAPDWKSAAGAAFPERIDLDVTESLPDNLEAAKEEAFDQDWLFDVVEI